MYFLEPFVAIDSLVVPGVWLCGFGLISSLAFLMCSPSWILLIYHSVYPFLSQHGSPFRLIQSQGSITVHIPITPKSYMNPIIFLEFQKPSTWKPQIKLKWVFTLSSLSDGLATTHLQKTGF